MKRLTKKNGFNYIPRHMYRDYNAVLNDVELEQAYNQCVDKLGKYEDLDEQLGIDLITLFKMLKQQKVCCIIEDIIIDNSFFIKIVFRNNEFQLELDGCYYLRLKDYGKTWALTREELED